jgi:rhodanese-related sulfurtransferase
METVIIDVRERDEFDTAHVEHSIHLPLNRFPSEAPNVLRSLSDKNILLMCRSGKRAGLALDHARSFGLPSTTRISVFEGGILAWEKQGRPVQGTQASSRLPIMRQVQLAAGLLILSSVTLAWFVNPAFILLAGFVGLGLTVAGTTGFCGMAILLTRAPWNSTQ